MKYPRRRQNSPFLLPLLTIAAATLTSCGSANLSKEEPFGDDLAADEDRTLEVLVSENPNKHLPMDFASASETARENQTFPGSFRVAADAIEIGRGTTGNIPNIGAQGEAYLEMPHPDGTPLHIRGNKIRSHEGTVTISGWPVVVREGKRLVGTTKETVIKIGSGGVQALGPSTVEDLVSGLSSFESADSVTPLPTIDSSTTPFIPLPPDFDLEAKPEVPKTDTVAKSGKRGIIDGKPVGKEPKRGFTGTYEGVENPKFPGDPSLKKTGDIDLSPAEVSTDFGLGNTPPIPSP